LDDAFKMGDLLDEEMVILSDGVALHLELDVLFALALAGVVGGLAIPLYALNAPLLLLGFRLGPFPRRKVGGWFGQLLSPCFSLPGRRCGWCWLGCGLWQRLSGLCLSQGGLCLARW